MAAIDLHHHVGQHLLGGEALGGPEADGDGRVEVPARDVADGVGHREDGEAERERHAEEAEAERVARLAPREVGGQHGGTTATEDQPERAERFGDELLAHLHGAPLRAELPPTSTTRTTLGGSFPAAADHAGSPAARERVSDRGAPLGARR